MGGGEGVRWEKQSWVLTLRAPDLALGVCFVPGSASLARLFTCAHGLSAEPSTSIGA